MTKNQQAILKGLAELYPNAGPELQFTNPYETLVATILAAQCTDARVNQVTPAVFRDFPDAKAMAQTTPEILFPYVKSCGFKSKAANIVNACKIIAEKYDGVVPSTLEELTALPGVGRKTANVVLAFSFGVPAIPVDTHVFRVANRLGLSDAMTVEETENVTVVPCDGGEWNVSLTGLGAARDGEGRRSSRSSTSTKRPMTAMPISSSANPSPTFCRSSYKSRGFRIRSESLWGS